MHVPVLPEYAGGFSEKSGDVVGRGLEDVGIHSQCQGHSRISMAFKQIVENQHGRGKALEGCVDDLATVCVFLKYGSGFIVKIDPLEKKAHDFTE